jgi:hypothetical protein
MKLLTGLFRVARKRLQTKDGGENFKESLMALVENADNLSEDDINAKIDELKVSIDDLPDDTEKEELSRYLEDFRTLKEQEPETAKEAAEMVIGLYDKLDASASADAPETAEIVEEKKPATDGGEAVETIAEEKKPAEVKDGHSDEELEEIYQYIKRRFDEDATTATDGGEAVETIAEEKTEETKDGCVKDSGVRVAVTLGGSSNASVDNLFNMLKNRRR